MEVELGNRLWVLEMGWRKHWRRGAKRYDVMKVEWKRLLLYSAYSRHNEWTAGEKNGSLQRGERVRTENNLVFFRDTKQVTLFTRHALLHSLKEHLRVPVSPCCSTDINHGSKLIATCYTLFTMSLYDLKLTLEHFQCCCWPMYMSVWYHLTGFFFPIGAVCFT